jgi:hypothetical protein
MAMAMNMKKAEMISKVFIGARAFTRGKEEALFILCSL